LNGAPDRLHNRRSEEAEMPLKLGRAWIFPEPELPDAAGLIAEEVEVMASNALFAEVFGARIG